MKILYLIPYNYSKVDGVVLKIAQQIGVWSRLGHDVMAIVISKQIPNEDALLTLPTRYKCYSKSFLALDYTDVLTEISNFQPDVVYLRRGMFRLLFTSVYKRYPTVLEVNTNDIAEFGYERFNSPKHFVKWLYNKMTHRRLYGGVKAYVSMTREIVTALNLDKSGKPVAVIPNTISLENNPAKGNNTSGQIRFVFMGSPIQTWQGVDKLIDFARKCEDVELNVIGLQESDIEMSVPPNVIMLGYLDKERYQKILSKCDIAFGTMALHRKGMNEGCPLKVREYLAIGLPVVIGYEDTAFNDGGYPDWILKIGNYENNVVDNVDLILNFAKRYKGFRLNHNDVGRYIDAKSWESRKLDFFDSIISSKV